VRSTPRTPKLLAHWNLRTETLKSKILLGNPTKPKECMLKKIKLEEIKKERKAHRPINSTKLKPNKEK